MTAAQIIDQIKSLPPEEQAGVVRFVYELEAERKLSGTELSVLADRFVNAISYYPELAVFGPCALIHASTRS